MYFFGCSGLSFVLISNGFFFYDSTAIFQSLQLLVC